MRISGVKLVAETAGYKRDMEGAAKATDKVTESVEDVTAAAPKMGAGLDGAGRQASGTGRAVDGLKRDLEQLDRQIALTEAELLSLSRAFAKTGDAGALKQIRAEESSLRSLGKLRKRIAAAGDDSAVEFASNFGGKLSPLLENLPVSPQIAAAVGGAAAVAAPLLGAAISGAIIGGVGIGGVAGGFALARKNPTVDAALGGFVQHLKSRLEEGAAAGFVEPTLAGIQEIERSLDNINFERIFANSGRLVEPLTKGVGSAMVDLGNGIDKLISKAGPAIEAISDGIADIGDHLGRGLADLADNGQAGADALRLIFSLINGSLDQVFGLVDLLTKVWKVMHAIGLDAGLEVFLKLTGAWSDGADEAHAFAEAAENAYRSVMRLKDGVEPTEKQLKDLADAQKEVTNAQDALSNSLDILSGDQKHAVLTADALKKAMDGLYGAAIRQTDANESYQDSWDSLSESVKKNKQTLDIHTAAGRANRDALEALLASSNELYIADINAGVSIERATKKHQERTVAVREEAKRVGLNKDATNQLISTYGRIPKRKETDILLEGVNAVADALLDLASIQLHLAKGTPLPAALSRRLARAQYGMPDTKRAHGGPLEGHAPHDRADNMIYAGTPGEWVIQRPTVRAVESKHGPGAMAYFNRYGELPHYATGGRLDAAARANWGGDLRYRVTAGMTKIPTLQQVINAVPMLIGNPGDWPSSPSAQRGDSGVWRSIVRLINSTGPLSGSFGNAYRPGDPLWHGSGRAVDWMGYNQDALASFLAARRPLELIHRTRSRDYAYTRGRNRGSFNNALMEAHRNHIHIAMAGGGVIGEPVLGFGASGATYSFAENGPERVLPAYQTGAAGGGAATYTTTVNLNVNLAAGANPREAGRQIAEQLGYYLKGGGSLWVKGRQVLP